ncbi:unnamed protein product, partial [Polarella glacialis]
VGAKRMEMTGPRNMTLFPSQNIFLNCAKEFMDKLCNLLHRKIFFPSQKIINGGSESLDMYAFTKGNAVVEKNGNVVGEMKEGSCFGEMAVLRVVTSQPLTLRADTMCDLQALSCWDLQELMTHYPAEKPRLLQAVAKMMREDLLEVSNLEVLSEVPLLSELPQGYLEKFDEVVSLKLARKDELILTKSDRSLILILLGKASLEVKGIPVQQLAEGDSYGETMALGLAQAPPDADVQLRVSDTSCLYLELSEQDFRDANFYKGFPALDELAGSVVESVGLRDKVLQRNPQLAHLQMTEEQFARLSSWCEEYVALSGQ